MKTKKLTLEQVIAFNRNVENEIKKQRKESAAKLDALFLKFSSRETILSHKAQ